MSKELREDRARLVGEMRELLEATEKSGMSQEDSEKYGKMEGEFNRLTTDLEARERAAGIEKSLAAPQGTPEGLIVSRDAKPYVDEARAYGKAFKRYMAGGVGSLGQEDRNALAKGAVENRAQGSGTGAAGGYLVPEEFLRQIWTARKFYGSVRNIAGNINTASGADMPYPNVNDTSNVGAILGENTAISNQDVSLGSRTLKAYMYTSKQVLVSYQLLQDSAFQIEPWLAGILGQRLGRIENTHFTTGTGANQPEGFMTNINTGVTTASTTAVTFDEIIGLVHSVDIAWRANARFQMHDLIVAEVRKLKDSQNRYLWEPGLQVGEPDRLLGWPISVNNDMDSVLTASKKVMAFGDFGQGYMVRDVQGLSVVRLDERYADALQVGFFAYCRLDGQPQFDTTALTGALHPYRALVLHA